LVTHVSGFRFAQFFLAPQLDNLTSMQLYKAIDEMDSEFELGKDNDELCIAMVERSLSKKNHPFSHLFFGKSLSLHYIFIPYPT
jgi:secreted Zn-dependent insulinase-like peptidase